MEVFSLNMEAFSWLLINAPIQFIIALFLLWIGMKFRHLQTSYNDEEIISKGNIALAIETTGYYTALLIIISASIYGESYGLINDMISIFSIGLSGIILLSVNRFLVDTTQLRAFKTSEEIEKNNSAYALIKGANYIATSIIIFQSFYGFEFNLGLLKIATIYFVLTQIFMQVVAEIFILKTSYDDIKELKNANLSVAIEHSGLLIALSILYANVAKEALELEPTTFMLVVLYFIISSVVLIYIPLLFTKVIVTKKMLNNKTIEDSIEANNPAIAVRSALMKIFIAMITVSFLPFDLILVK